MWDEVMIADLKYFDGNLARIDRVPLELRRLYATAFEVDPVWLVEAAARRQKWIDQSQSLISTSPTRPEEARRNLQACLGARPEDDLLPASLGATHAENRPSIRAIERRSVRGRDARGGHAAESEGPTFCGIDNPECERASSGAEYRETRDMLSFDDEMG